MLDNLYRLFSHVAIEAKVREGMQQNLKKHWAKNADHELFIVFILLNLYI